MREDQRRAALHQPLQRLLDRRLVLRIDRGERLVEDEDRGVEEQRARDRDALALAAREARPALADARFVAFGQGEDEIMRVGRARGGLDLRLARVGAAEVHFLRQAFLRTARRPGRRPRWRRGGTRVERAEVRPAEQDFSRLGVVFAEQQPDDRGFAGPARPDDSDALAGGNAEGKPVDGGGATAGIGEIARNRRRRSARDRRRRRSAGGRERGTRFEEEKFPAAADWPSSPLCRTVRRSRSGRKISVPAISTISRAARLISPA